MTGCGVCGEQHAEWPEHTCERCATVFTCPSSLLDIPGPTHVEPGHMAIAILGWQKDGDGGRVPKLGEAVKCGPVRPTEEATLTSTQRAQRLVRDQQRERDERGARPSHLKVVS